MARPPTSSGDLIVFEGKTDAHARDFERVVLYSEGARVTEPVAPPVTFIVPTRNSEVTLAACLSSIRTQAYDNVEIVVVDNYSADGSVEIAQQFADSVSSGGPERSAQRNAGARLARGEILVFVDSDMLLDAEVATEVVSEITKGASAVVIPERVEGEGYWQRVRGLEKRLILGDADLEAARAFPRLAFQSVGCYDETLVAGPEDWDLSDRIQALFGRASRTSHGIRHVEEQVSLASTFRKKRYYGASVRRLVEKDRSGSARRMVRATFFRRLLVAGIQQPQLAVGLCILKAVEFIGIAVGLLGWASRGPSTVYGGSSAESVLVATHELFADGAAQALYRHLERSGRDARLLLLPFPEAPERRVGWAHRGRLRRLPTPSVRALPILAVRDVLLLLAAFFANRKPTIFVGVDPVNCGVGIICRKLRLWSPRTIVLYSIDFVPRRFANDFFNGLYHRLDRWCGRHADVVWNVSGEIQGKRTAARSGPWAPAVVVPIGVEEVAAVPPALRQRLVFIGHLLEKQGVRHAITALPLIHSELPNVVLEIAGVGPAEHELRDLTTALGLEGHVRFVGYLETQSEIRAFLEEGGLGLAPYEEDPDSFTRWADPTKLKTYLAAGLPVLVTDVPPTATALVHAGCARLVRPTATSVAAAAIELLSDPSAYHSASVAALDRAERMRWQSVFAAALTATERVGVSRSRHVRGDS